MSFDETLDLTADGSSFYNVVRFVKIFGKFPAWNLSVARFSKKKIAHMFARVVSYRYDKRYGFLTGSR